MIIETQRTLIVELAENWKSTYYGPSFYDGKRAYGWNWLDPEKEAIYEKLRALPPDLPAEVYNDVIGNDSWTYLACEECKESQTMIIVVAENTQLCLRCLQKAQEMLQQWKKFERGED